VKSFDAILNAVVMELLRTQGAKVTDKGLSRGVRCLLAA
jgi:hypothetical protein